MPTGVAPTTSEWSTIVFNYWGESCIEGLVVNVMPSVHPTLSFYVMTHIHTQLIVMTSAVFEKMTHYLETFSQKYMHIFAIEVMGQSAFFHYCYITYNQCWNFPWLTLMVSYRQTGRSQRMVTGTSQVVSILFNWVNYKDGLEFICPSGKCIFKLHLWSLSRI